MEKSSHLREATMVLSGGRGRGGFTATLSYSIALFLYDDTWSGPHISQNQPRHHCSEHYLQQIIKRLRPSSWHWVSRQISNEWYSLRSDHRPWLFSVECLFDTFKGRLPSQGAAFNHSNWARCALEVKAAKPQTFWEEKIFVPYFIDSPLWLQVQACLWPVFRFSLQTGLGVWWFRVSSFLGKLEKEEARFTIWWPYNCQVHASWWPVHLVLWLLSAERLVGPTWSLLVLLVRIPQLPSLHSTCRPVNLTQCHTFKSPSVSLYDPP